MPWCHVQRRDKRIFHSLRLSPRRRLLEAKSHARPWDKCVSHSSAVLDARYMLDSAGSVSIVTALELPRFRLCDDSLMVSASAGIPSVWWSSVELSFDFALR